jgi:hypothetical protein
VRTRDDLAAAFALIADEAEAYLAAPTPAGPARRRRRAIVWLAAAAVIVLVGAGGLWVRAQFTPAGTGPASGNGSALPLRSVLFTLPRSASFAIEQVSNRADEQLVDVRVDGVRHEVELWSPSASVDPQLDVDPRTAERVDINGRTGYYGCGGHASDPPACNPHLSTLAWRFGPDGWAQIFGRTSAATKTQLLRLARAMDFARTGPLRSPVAISAAPRGTRLSELDLGYRRPRSPHAWSFTAFYEAAGSVGGANEIGINVSTIPIPRHGGSGRAVEVGRHPGWWEPGDNHNEPSRLFVDAGHGRSILVIGGASSGAPIPRTVEAFGRVARSVRFAPDLADPRTWWDAETALP